MPSMNSYDDEPELMQIMYQAGFRFVHADCVFAETVHVSVEVDRAELDSTLHAQSVPVPPASVCEFQSFALETNSAIAMIPFRPVVPLHCTDRAVLGSELPERSHHEFGLGSLSLVAFEYL